MNGAMTKARSRGRSASVITTVPRLAAAVLIGAGLLSACSGTPGTTTAEKSTGSATASKPSSSPTGKATTKATSKGGTTGAGVGARADLSDFSCGAASTGVWSAKGTLHNATNAAVKYSVMVSVASTKTSTVVGSTTKTVTLDAGKSEQFTVDQVATHKADGLACTAHVTRVSST